MDDESKKLLKETYNLVAKNNEMLRKIRGVQKRQVIFGMIKTIVIIGVALGIFYYIEPYFDKILEFLDSVYGIEAKFKESGIESFFQGMPR